jgi:hypothetical protein
MEKSYFGGRSDGGQENLAVVSAANKQDKDFSHIKFC